MVMPGDNVKIGVKLISIAMDPGLHFAIREGGRTIGLGVVANITSNIGSGPRGSGDSRGLVFGP
ncbi:MAG: hypothetical protein R3E11_10800 [Sphingobium sp.]